jgi:hypothetical protein
MEYGFLSVLAFSRAIRASSTITPKQSKRLHSRMEAGDTIFIWQKFYTNEKFRVENKRNQTRNKAADELPCKYHASTM